MTRDRDAADRVATVGRLKAAGLDHATAARVVRGVIADTLSGSTMSADNQTQFRANWFAAVVEVYGEELADIEHDRQHREGDSCEHCPKTGGGCNQCR